MMKTRPIVCVSMLLAAASTRAEWKTQTSVDPMNDSKVHMATLQSDKGAMVLDLQCTVGKKRPESMIQLKVNDVLDWTLVSGARRVRIDFRFDAEKAISRLGDAAQGGTTWIMVNSSLSKDEPREFVKLLASHARLTARPPMHKGGLVDTFDLTGCPVDLFPKGCF